MLIEENSTMKPSKLSNSFKPIKDEEGG